MYDFAWIIDVQCDIADIYLYLLFIIYIYYFSLYIIITYNIKIFLCIP